MPLPSLPGHKVSVVSEATEPPSKRGFLFLRRARIVATFAGAETTQPFDYDIVDRTRLDAVIIAPHWRGPDGEPWVVLRSAIRPPLALRPLDVRPVPEKASLGELWELPAGLVEEDERSPEGLRACAARELFEETGFQVVEGAMAELGPSMFPVPAMIGERHFFFRAEVDPARRVRPPEDGSPLERHAKLVDVPLREALDACRSGAIEDSKTELALRRLADLLLGHS